MKKINRRYPQDKMAKFILCSYPLLWKGDPYVHHLGTTFQEACAGIPLALEEEPDDQISLCSVDHWVEPSDYYHGLDSKPCGVVEIFQIAAYDPEALHDNEDEDQ